MNVAEEDVPEVPWERALETALLSAVESSEYDFDEAARQLRRIIKIEDVRVRTSTRRRVNMFTAVACRLKFAQLDAGGAGASSTPTREEYAQEYSEAHTKNDIDHDLLSSEMMIGLPDLSLGAQAEALLASLEEPTGGSVSQTQNTEDLTDNNDKHVSSAKINMPSGSELSRVLEFLDLSSNSEQELKPLSAAFTDRASKIAIEMNDQDVRIEHHDTTDRVTTVDPGQHNVAENITSVTSAAPSRPPFDRRRRGTRDEVYAASYGASNRRSERASFDQDHQDEQDHGRDDTDGDEEQEEWQAMRRRTKG